MMTAKQEIVLDLENERNVAFSALRRTGAGSDMTFIVQGRCFHVHSFLIRALIPECVMEKDERFNSIQFLYFSSDR